VKVTKRFTFEASHYLERGDLTPKQNVEHYHACSGFKDCIPLASIKAEHLRAAREPHGHSYILEVTVRGHINADGFVIDFKRLKAIVKEEVVDKCDHRLLNNVEMLKGRTTTCENMLEVFAPVLKKALKKADKSVVLDRLRLWETADSYAEWESTW
jgi:6-pyruvoyltetrahydropterin/6-carboxytetrahydropterin synthase